MISIDLPNWNLRFKCAKNQNVLEIVSLPQTVQSHSTPEFVKRSCADMKETYRHMKKHRAVTIRISYFCIELVSKQLCQVLWILQRNDSCTMALFKRKVNVFVMAERSRDDELNRTVQAETRQGRAEFVCRSHVRAKGEWSTLHLLTLQYSIIICISISMNLFSYIIILNNYRYFFRDTWCLNTPKWWVVCMQTKMMKIPGLWWCDHGVVCETHVDNRNGGHLKGPDNPP